MQWESQVVNGLFPLNRLLGGTDHGAVFLTEHRAQSLPSAAIKLVPVETAAPGLLSRWKAAAALSHPHLLRLFESGRSQLAGRPFLFVVMEYADETLAQILPQRALTTAETREMLLPVLDALSFLHRQRLVHGAIKPTNILVVNDQLKLASDTIRPADQRASAAADVWGVGTTIVEALTQRAPTWPDQQSEIVILPATFAPPFRQLVLRCLNRDPGRRPTVAELEDEIKGVTRASPTVSAAATRAATNIEPAVRSESSPPAAPTAPPVRGPSVTLSAPPPVSSVRSSPSPSAEPASSAAESAVPRSWGAAIIGLLLLAAGLWGGLHLFKHRSSSPQAVATQQVTPPAAPSPEPATSPVGTGPPDSESNRAAQIESPPAHPAATPQNTTSASSDGSSVLHEELPGVSRSALNTIHGRIRVTVRVAVDDSGNVVEAILLNPGSSQYFARAATEAARKWKFAPGSAAVRRKWLLQFEFTRAGATAHPMSLPS